MNPDAIVSVVMDIESRAWVLWGLITTVNLAVLTWLFTIGGLVSTYGKIVASIIYTVFLSLMTAGFWEIYYHLDLAMKDLIHAVDKKSTEIATQGLISHLACQANAQVRCHPTDWLLPIAVIINMGGLVIMIYLFWSNRVWEALRGYLQEKSGEK